MIAIAGSNADNREVQQVFLTTSRVRLRQCEPEDSPLLRSLDHDPEVMRYLTGGAAPSEEQARAGLARIMENRARFEGRLGLFIAELIEGSEYIGFFLLRPARADPENLNDLEIGYRLKRCFWNQGLATEVSRELIRYAFEERAATSVLATAMKKNLASRRVMEKLGMRLECEFVDPDYVEITPDELDVRYRVTREEWDGLEVVSRPQSPLPALPRSTGGGF